MRPHDKNTRPAARYLRSKEIFLQEQEEDSKPAFYGDEETEHNFHPLPMKWHSNKWAQEAVWVGTPQPRTGRE